MVETHHRAAPPIPHEGGKLRLWPSAKFVSLVARHWVIRSDHKSRNHAQFRGPRPCG